MKKKIMQVIPSLNMGGAENLVKEYLLAIDPDRYNVEVFVLGSRIGSILEFELEKHGKKVTFLSELYTVPPSLPAPVRRAAVAFGWRTAIRRYLKKTNPDVVHCHLSVANKLVVGESILRSKAVFYTVHSDPDKYWGGGNGQREKKAIGILIRRCGMHMIALHRDAVPKIKKYFGEDCSVSVLNNAVDFGRYRNPEKSGAEKRAELGIPADAFLVGHVGRFFEPKNHAFLVEIFACILKKQPHAHLLLVGDGPMRGEIEKKSCTLGIGHAVTFTGNRNDVNEILSTLDLFLFPSLWEGFPITLIEAQAAGVRCFVSDVLSKEAFLTNLVESVNLSESAEVWANRILANEHREYEEYGIEEYHIDTAVGKLLTTYERVMKGEGL